MMIKELVNTGLNMDLNSALAHEARCFEILFSTDDQKEGMRAFVEKRKPVFTGRQIVFRTARVFSTGA